MPLPSDPFILPKSLFTSLKTLSTTKYTSILPSHQSPSDILNTTSKITFPPNSLITYPTQSFPPSTLKFYSPLIKLLDTSFGLLGRNIRYRPKHVTSSNSTTCTQSSEWWFDTVLNLNFKDVYGEGRIVEYVINNKSIGEVRDVCKGGSRSVINEIDYDIQVEVIINCADFDGLFLGKCDEVEDIFEKGSGGREFERNKEWEVYRNRILRLFEGRREEFYPRQFGRILFTFPNPKSPSNLKAKVKLCTIPERTQTGRRPYIDADYEFHTIYNTEGESNIIDVDLDDCYLLGDITDSITSWHTSKGYYIPQNIYCTTNTQEEQSNLKKKPLRACHLCRVIDPKQGGSYKRCKNVQVKGGERVQCVKLWCGECSDSSKIKPCCTLTCPCISCKWSSLTRQESTHPSGCPACSLPLTSDLAELKRCVLCRKWFHNKCAVWEDRLQKDLKGEYGRKQVDSRRANASSNVGRIVCYGCTVDKGLGGFGGWLKNGVGLEGGVEVFTLGFTRGYGKSDWREVAGGGEMESDSEIEESEEEQKRKKIGGGLDSDSDSDSDSDDDIFVKKPKPPPPTKQTPQQPAGRIPGILYIGDTDDVMCEESKQEGGLHDWLTIIPYRQRKPGHRVLHAIHGRGEYVENAGPARVKVDFDDGGVKIMWAAEVEVVGNIEDAIYTEEEFREVEEERKRKAQKEKDEKEAQKKIKLDKKKESGEKEEERRKIEKEKRERIKWKIIVQKEKERKEREEKKRKRELDGDSTEEGWEGAGTGKIRLKDIPGSSRKIGMIVSVKDKPGEFVIVEHKANGKGGFYYVKYKVFGSEEVLKFKSTDIFVDSSCFETETEAKKEEESGADDDVMDVVSDDSVAESDSSEMSSSEDENTDDEFYGVSTRVKNNNPAMITNVTLPSDRMKSKNLAMGRATRCMPYEPGTMFSKKTELREESCAPTNNFNLNLRQTSSLLTAAKQEKATSVRAARASQRRMFKDDTILGMNIERMNVREPKLRFARSGIHGWGVFSQETIPKDALITEYRGELIRTGGIADRREQEYERTKVGSDYMFRIDDNWICDATKKGAMARYINASCDPNCRTQIVEVNKVKKICIYALRQIEFGEELVYDYKFPIERDKEERIRCYCGAARCKQWMNWDFRWEDDESEEEDEFLGLG
ncbi:hypothetical protein TrLO_g746 [Triparma laevis f. longispina]|uniref:[histone H3]-lysine(4) N-trimethyltransferase n=1 Tax=Triparma laevis f. longispina TaxID=1714387 RepID=A0A9W7C0P5_9STRA|nr:hypothetical protein TrLO_g746 [Triparma laevis f. longispina]